MTLLYAWVLNVMFTIATYPITHYYTMSLCAAHAASHGMWDWLFMIACYTQCTQHAIITGTSPNTHPSNKLEWPDSISVY